MNKQLKIFSLLLIQLLFLSLVICIITFLIHNYEALDSIELSSVTLDLPIWILNCQSHRMMQTQLYLLRNK